MWISRHLAYALATGPQDTLMPRIVIADAFIDSEAVTALGRCC